MLVMSRESLCESLCNAFAFAKQPLHRFTPQRALTRPNLQPELSLMSSMWYVRLDILVLLLLRSPRIGLIMSASSVQPQALPPSHRRHLLATLEHRIC